MAIDIRLYRPTDLEHIYRICLLTGADGKDATSRFKDPKLLGHYYAAPYPAMDPLLCLVVSCDGEPSGYILGTDDSTAFRNWTEVNWFPALRAQYTAPDDGNQTADAGIVRLIHSGYEMPSEGAGYPAHLHIDLLPLIQGRGVGREVSGIFLDLLRARGCQGVHLGVSATNPGAMGFYESIGFKELARDPGGRVYGFKLSR